MHAPIFDLLKWRERVLEIRDPKTRAENLEFCHLVESVGGMDNIEVVRILFKMFTDKPDHGVKETVLRVLATFDVETYYRAYLEELPRLTQETRKQGWYMLLATYPGKESMGQEDCDALISVVKGMPGEIQRIFLSVIRREDYLLHNDWAEYVLEKLQKKGLTSRSAGKKTTAENHFEMKTSAPVDTVFDLDALLKEGEGALDEFPYDGASWHFESKEYPPDLPHAAAFTHLGIYLGWAIERDLISDTLKERYADEIEKFRKRKILPSEVFRICCVDELTQDHLNDTGNAFTKKYYRPGWEYYYPADFDELSGNEISGFYMRDTWENYERVKAVIDKRYEEWMKEPKAER